MRDVESDVLTDFSLPHHSLFSSLRSESHYGLGFLVRHPPENGVTPVVILQFQILTVLEEQESKQAKQETLLMPQTTKEKARKSIKKLQLTKEKPRKSRVRVERKELQMEKKRERKVSTFQMEKDLKLLPLVLIALDQIPIQVLQVQDLRIDVDLGNQSLRLRNLIRNLSRKLNQKI